MKHLLIAGLCLLQFANSVLSREPIKDIRSVLSRSEFKSAGLHKLSDMELDRLSGALYGWEEIECAGPKAKVSMNQEASFGNEKIVEKETIKKQQETKIIYTTIKGEFKGWSGKTNFALENGQVWRQTDGKKLVIRTNDPVVEIKRGMMGAYYLKVKGWGKRCKVERIK